MGWIDDDLEERRKLDEDAGKQQDRELHRGRLTEAKGRELWDTLKTECKEIVAEFNRKSGDVRYDIVYEDRGPDSFDVARTSGRTTLAMATLRISGYKIHVVHKTPIEGLTYRDEERYFTFDCDGLDVWLMALGKRVTTAYAAEQIVRPVTRAALSDPTHI